MLFCYCHYYYYLFIFISCFEFTLSFFSLYKLSSINFLFISLSVAALWIESPRPWQPNPANFFCVRHSIALRLQTKQSQAYIIHPPTPLLTYWSLFLLSIHSLFQRFTILAHASPT